VVAKKVKVKYTPIGDSVSPESTFVQAAIALDVAAQFAVADKSAKQMNRTAELWIEMAKALMGLDEEDESGPQPEHTPLGFRIDTDKEPDVRIDGEESDFTPSEG
jgi:hypothetical protein